MERAVPKKTGTYADALEAIGLATLLEEIGFRGVTIRDSGSEFQLQTANEIPSSDWTQLQPGYPYIWQRSEEERPQFQWLVDYEDGKVKSEVWKKYQQAQRKTRGRAKAALEDQAIESPPQPPREYKTASILASMRKGWSGDSDLAIWLRDHPTDALEWIRESMGETAQVGARPKISNTQILNPISGKGINSPKTEWRTPGSISAALIDPFSEWMKIRGLWAGMLLFRTDDDFKFFAIEPALITVGGLRTVRDALDGFNLWGGVRLDIEATLRCVEVLIKYSDMLQSDQAPVVSLRQLTPRRVVAGLRQAYFKSLGSAAALMNDALLPLPDWFAVNCQEDANDYLEIIDEAIGSFEGGTRKAGCLGSLEEKNSDDGEILQQYRRWLLTGDLPDLLEFHHQFALHLMQRLSKNEWARPFSTKPLDTLLTKSYARKEPMLKRIIEDDGFKSLARAIRNSTIYAFRFENREVHFGLAQKWKQKMRAGEKEFVSELSEFVQEHNWEVIHKMNGGAHVVDTADLDAVITLIHEHGADLVGSLLLAYGYARAPKVEGSLPKEAVATGNN
jgi:hypothetical protein